MPLAEVQVDAQQKQSVEEKLSTPAVDVSVPAGQAQLPVLVNGDALLSAQVDSQQPVSEKPVETVVSPAPAVPETLSAAAPVRASEVSSCDVAKPVETLRLLSRKRCLHLQRQPPKKLRSSSPSLLLLRLQSRPRVPHLSRHPFTRFMSDRIAQRLQPLAEAERIKAKGHDAFVEQADLGRRGTWYRVKVGRFKSRSEAEQLMKKIHKVLVQDSVVVRNPTD